VSSSRDYEFNFACEFLSRVRREFAEFQLEASAEILRRRYGSVLSKREIFRSTYSAVFSLSACRYTWLEICTVSKFPAECEQHLTSEAYCIFISALPRYVVYQFRAKALERDFHLMAHACILAVVKSSTVRNLATIMPKCTQLQNSLLTVVSPSVVTRTEAPCLRSLNDTRYTIDVAQVEERSKIRQPSSVSFINSALRFAQLNEN